MRKLRYLPIYFMLIYGKMMCASSIEEGSFFQSPYKQVIRGMRRSSFPSDYKQEQNLTSHSLLSENDKQHIEIKSKKEKKSEVKKICSSLPDMELKNLKISELNSLLEEKEREKIKKEHELTLSHLKEIEVLTQKLHSSEIESLLLKEKFQLREKEIEDAFHKKEINLLAMVSEKEKVYLQEKNQSHELFNKKEKEFEIIKIQKEEDLKKEKEEKLRLSLLCDKLKEEIKEKDVSIFQKNILFDKTSVSLASLKTELNNEKVRYGILEKQHQETISQKDAAFQKLKNDLTTQNLLVDNLKKQIPEIEKLKAQIALKNQNDLTNANLQKALQNEKNLLQNQITLLNAEKTRMQKETITLNAELIQLRQKISGYAGYEKYSISMSCTLKYVNNTHFATSTWLLKPEQRYGIANLLAIEKSGIFKINKL